METYTEGEWKTELGYKLAIGVAVITILISLLDIFHAPIFIRETASTKAQVIGQDIVNLVIGVPATFYSLNLSKKGSLKARTVLIGIMAFFAYTFLSYSILFKLNDGFLLYTAGFGFSLYATLLNIAALNVNELRIDADPYVRRWTQVVMGFIILVVIVLWTPDIVYYYTTGLHPERIIADNVHTLAIHFQDLSIVVPLALMTAWLIRRDDKMGYVLAPILLVKALSIGLAVLGMITAMSFWGVPAVLGEIMVFFIATLVLGWYTIRFYKGTKMEYVH
ncbi:hypothetical protein ACFL0D_09140 [Thermoproteota archaeon]